MDSERRHATVLFADFSGYEKISKLMDPEDLAAVMNRCFAVFEALALRYGGTANKYIGDCIMATFGAATALENTARAAVNAAIEMRNSMPALNEELHPPVPLGIHIGINTGVLVAGEVGGPVTGRRDVTGETVILASRLKDKNTAGKIWVGPNTHRYTRSEFEYKRFKIYIKHGQRIQVFELLSVKQHPHPRRALGPDRFVFAQLIGRAEELDQIRAALARVAAGRGGIVSLVGDAGLGKSRLVAEALEPAATQGIRCLEGRSLSIGQKLSFHPFIDLLRRWATITDEDGESAALAKLEAATAAVLREEAGEVLPFVATLMGMRLSGVHAERVAGIAAEGLEKLVVKSVRDLVQAMTRERPLVLVFEDVHWADASSVMLLEALIRLAVDHPILFLLVFRPDGQPAVHRMTRAFDERSPDRHVRIALEPLDRRQCDLLIQDLLKSRDIPFPLRAEIARKVGGNPLFIEEVVRDLIDQGVIKYENDTFSLTEEVESVPIPGTIQELFMARVDRLPASAKSLAQMASVIGPSFQYGIVAAVARREARTLESDLQHLQRRQLITERRTGHGREYLFKHALMQETIYESILHRTRKELHLQVAVATEQLFHDRLPDVYGMLAYHFSRGADLEKAEDYLFKAALEAVRAAASTEALAYFEEAARLYFALHGEGGDPARKALLQKNMGLALLRKGNLLESIDHFNKSLELLGERVPKGTVALTTHFAIDLAVVLVRLYLNRLSGPSRSNDREVFEIRYNRARAQTTTDARRWAFDTIGTVRRLSTTDPHAIDHACGMYAGAAALFTYSGLSFGISRRFLGVAERLIREGNVRDLVVYRVMRFVLHYLQGSWDDGYALDDNLVEAGLRHGELWDVTTYLDLNCARKIRQGDWAEAGRLLDRLAEVADVYGYEWARSTELGRAAFLLLEQRRLDEARRTIDQYDAARLEETLNLWALGIRAKIQALLDDREGAAATLAKAEIVLRQSRQVPAYHLSAFLAARLLVDVTELEECMRNGGGVAASAHTRRARRSIRRSERVASKVATVRPEIYRLAARVWWLVGKPAEAVGSWARSIRECERLGARPELARSYMEAGQRLTAAGGTQTLPNGMSASACLQKAESLFTELGLAWDQAQLSAARSVPREGRVDFESPGEPPRNDFPLTGVQHLP